MLGRMKWDAGRIQISRCRLVSHSGSESCRSDPSASDQLDAEPGSRQPVRVGPWFSRRSRMTKTKRPRISGGQRRERGGHGRGRGSRIARIFCSDLGLALLDLVRASRPRSFAFSTSSRRLATSWRLASMISLVRSSMSLRRGPGSTCLSRPSGPRRAAPWPRPRPPWSRPGAPR